MWRGVGGEVVAVLGVGDGDGDGDGMDGSEGSENRVVCGGKGKGKVGNSILPETRGIKVFDIPKGSGILNQEGQCVDGSGGVFVLNRENRSGEERWVVYWKSGGDSGMSTFPSSFISLLNCYLHFPLPTSHFNSTFLNIKQ